MRSCIDRTAVSLGSLLRIFFLLQRLYLVSAHERDLNILGVETYGPDVSFPMQRSEVSTNYPWLPHNIDSESNPIPEEYKNMPIQPLGMRHKFYEDYIQGCRDFYGLPNGGKCDSYESNRISLMLTQPQSMKNFTKMGFAKIRAPDDVFQPIKEFWDKNHLSQTVEPFPVGYSFVNNWEVPSTVVSTANTTLTGGGPALNRKIWKAAQTILEQWSGQKLTSCSLFGVRVYHEKAVLAPHVDRLPLVTSAIINVAQDVDEPWPLEVIGHDGKAYNITMEPGDMVLYESHSIPHGRPFPLKGRFFANVFIHFEPLGEPLDGAAGKSQHHELKSVLSKNPEHNMIPPYVISNSIGDSNFRKNHPEGWQPASGFVATGVISALEAAGNGDLESLKEIGSTNIEEMHKKDENGWQPIHMASRSGHLEAIKFLVENGADLNNLAGGQTPLHIAKTANGHDHPVVTFLTGRGALDIGEKTAKDSVYSGDVEYLKDLLSLNPAEMSKIGQDGRQLIHEAAQIGQLHIVKLLVENGADINSLALGKSPLNIAKEVLGLEHPVVGLLNEHGALDIGVQNAKDAVYAGDLASLKVIVALNPKEMHVIDYNGWQLIHEASRSGQLEIVKFLAQNGADLSMLASGKTPLRIAIEKHGVDHTVVDFLKGLGALDIGP